MSLNKGLQEMLGASFRASWLQHFTGLEGPFRDFQCVHSTTVFPPRPMEAGLRIPATASHSLWDILGKGLSSTGSRQQRVTCRKELMCKLLPAHSPQRWEVSLSEKTILVGQQCHPIWCSINQ